MNDFFDKVLSDKDPLVKIIDEIPGFKGYIERQNRRDADKLLRDMIVTHFGELRARISDLQQEFSNAGELSYLDDLETAASKIQTFNDKMGHAAYGYSGFFDAVKINEEELLKIYQFDAGMLALEDEIGRAIDNVGSSVGSDGLPAAVRHLVALTRDLVTTYHRRDELITSID